MAPSLPPYRYAHVEEGGDPYPDLVAPDAGTDSLTYSAGGAQTLTGTAATGGSGSFTYLWTAPSGTLTNATNLTTATFKPTAAGGAVVLTLTATDTATGLTASDTVTINVPALVAPDAGTDSGVWPVGVQTLAGTAATGGAGTITYAWTIVSGGTGTFSDATSRTSTWAPNDGAAYSLRLTATDAIGQTANDTVSLTFSYAAGDAGATAFSSDIASAGGSELVEYWLAHDHATYRTIGTGISDLIGQKAAINATQGTAGKQPTMQATGAANSRGAAQFTKAATSSMVTGASFASLTTDRWCVLDIGKLTTSPPTAKGRMMEIGVPAAGGDALHMYFNTTPTLEWGVNTFGNVTDAYNSTAALAMSVACSNLNVKYLNGTSATTAGIGAMGTRGNGNMVLGFGRACDADSGHLDWDFWARCVFKMSGTAVPSGHANIMRCARAYYGTTTL